MWLTLDLLPCTVTDMSSCMLPYFLSELPRVTLDLYIRLIILIIRGQYLRCLSIFVERTSTAHEFVKRSAYASCSVNWGATFFHDIGSFGYKVKENLQNHK